MIFRKLSQPIAWMILMITLSGCASPVTPLASAIPTQQAVESPVPTKAEAKTITFTPTLNPVSTFEECIIIGKLIENTYPRQCISNTGEFFSEELPEGVIISKVFGAPGHSEKATLIIPTMDNGYLITGSASGFQCLLRKLDASGEIEWEHTLGIELREEFQFPNSGFDCMAARQTSNGNYVIMSIGHVFESVPQVSRYFIFTFDPDGNRTAGEEFLWRGGMGAKFDSEGNLIWYSLFGLAGKLIETSDGGYTVAGRFSDDSPDSSTHIIKADKNGNFEWEKNLCLDNNVQEAWQEEIVCSYNNLWDAIQLDDGGYALTGGFGNGIWLVKTDAKGNVELISSYLPESGSAVGHAIIQTSDGGFLIAGQTNRDAALIKTDSTGNQEWSRTFGGDQYDTFIRMKQGLNAEYVILGVTKSFGEGAENSWLLAIDPSAFK